MRGIAGFTQLYSQPADVAELIRRMTVSADAARAGRRKISAIDLNGMQVWRIQFLPA
jgi:hypothetical protein